MENKGKWAQDRERRNTKLHIYIYHFLVIQLYILHALE